MQELELTFNRAKAQLRFAQTLTLGTDYLVRFKGEEASSATLILTGRNYKPVAISRPVAEGIAIDLDTAELLAEYTLNGMLPRKPVTAMLYATLLENGETIAIGYVQVVYSSVYTAKEGTLTAIDTKGAKGDPGIQGEKGESGRDGIVVPASGQIGFGVPSSGEKKGHLLAYAARGEDFYSGEGTQRPRFTLSVKEDGKKHLLYHIYTEGGDAAIDLGDVSGAKGDKGDAGSYEFDNEPKQTSSNPVTSSGIWAAIENERARAEAAETGLAHKISTVYKFKGSVPDAEHLPNVADVGDVYNASDSGMNYAYQGGGVWDALGSFFDLSVYATKAETGAALEELNDAITAELESKVDKETGKVLSSNDFTDEEKTKLAGIEAGAQVNGAPYIAGSGIVIGEDNTISAKRGFTVTFPANIASAYSPFGDSETPSDMRIRLELADGCTFTDGTGTSYTELSLSLNDAVVMANYRVVHNVAAISLPGWAARTGKKLVYIDPSDGAIANALWWRKPGNATRGVLLMAEVTNPYLDPALSVLDYVRAINCGTDAVNAQYLSGRYVLTEDLDFSAMSAFSIWWTQEAL